LISKICGSSAASGSSGLAMSTFSRAERLSVHAGVELDVDAE
jgi:hypothetical protein